jgi:hypothetical protein
LNSLIFPLLEQNLSDDEEHKIVQGIDNIIFENSLKIDSNKLITMVESLESELRGWQ